MIEIPAIAGMQQNAAASEDELQALEGRLGRRLTQEHRQLLSLSDGFSIGGGLLLYSTAEIEERNTTWEVQVYAPGYIAIGDTGGGDVITIFESENPSRVFVVGAGTMDPADMREVAPSIEQWLNNGCRTRPA